MKRITSLWLVVLMASCSHAPEKTRLVLAATTSIEDTGLLDVINREFSKAHPEIEISPVAVGTGQAIKLARTGDADVVLSHDSAAEMQLVTEGLAVERRAVMQNDFIVAGPANDPAHAKSSDAIACFRAIAQAPAVFVSRADDSGTNRKELKIWKAANITPAGDWYLKAGLGMGDALLLAGEKRAYLLTDRGTYLKFRPRIDLAILCEGDPLLLNKYGVTIMKGPRRKAAEVFANWITSDSVQKLIGEFGKAQYGQPLFTPTAHASTLGK